MAMLLENKKIYFDYEILEKLEVGLQLRGWEVKSFRQAKANLVGSRIIIRGREIYAIGIDIFPYQPVNIPKGAETQRTIKLLAKKKEIDYLEEKSRQKGLTIMPLKVYDKKGKIKMEIVLVKGKKKYDKREKIKERETKRNIERLLKGSERHRRETY